MRRQRLLSSVSPSEAPLGVLKTLCRIFLKEFLKENDDRLWNIFESFKR